MRVCSSKQMRAVVLLACLLAVCHAQVRTALPQYTFVEYGLFDCSSAEGMRPPLLASSFPAFL
jgi:hypothetical protein